MYKCKIATLREIKKKFDYEQAKDPDNPNWAFWKKQAISNFQNGYTITYVGKLNGEIICECAAIVEPSVPQNVKVTKRNVYLVAFRTNEEYQGQGYFSKLYHFMIADLKARGYTKATLGVEPHEHKNKAIYTKWGYTKYLGTAKEYYPDGTFITVEFYQKNL